MQIAVISQIRPGSPRAHAINVIKTAGGFERLGHAVTVYCLPPEDNLDSQPGAAYGEHQLHWCFAPEAATEDPEAFGRWAARAARAAHLVYARNFWAPLLTARSGIPTVLESHAHAETENPLLDRCLRATQNGGGLNAIVTIGEVLRADFVRRGAEASRVHVIPDGVDFELFDGAEPRDYGGGGPHALYAGHLYDYKGIPTVLGAARLTPECCFHLLGGIEADIARVRRRVAELGLTNVEVHGRVDHAAVPPWTTGADLLLLPPSGGEASKDWTSPVKLAEYLASGPPLVVSRIPALVDALDREPVVWFEPDDPASLAGAVEIALGARDDHAGRARRRALAHGLSYPARAARILAAADSQSRAAA